MIISKKNFDAMLNRSYLNGYSAGKKDGFLEGVLNTNTPNQIREAFGCSTKKTQ